MWERREALSDAAPTPISPAPALSGANRYQQMRRSGEVLTVCILLALTLLLMMIIAAMIKWEGSGPVFERRQRMGRDGRRFQMLSFRTTAYRPGQRASNWQTTPLGQFLKSTRMNALPQLFNVLHGDIGINDTALFD